MVKRRNSCVRLDYYHEIIRTLFLSHQNPITGLLPSLSQDYDHAWIRDNVYSILAVWALSLAYKKIADQSEDQAKTYELGRRFCIKNFIEYFKKLY